MTDSAPTGPKLSPELLARILGKLELTERPARDLAGLNRLYAAYCGQVPNDNIQKRIWLTGKQTDAVTGGDPVEFFENWLTHGTGGTCFPAGGGLCALLRALGFNAKHFSGSVMMEGIEQGANHGSVLVALEGTDYLVDAQHASFTALPIIPGQPSSTGNGIHDIHSVPVAGGFELQCYPGSNRWDPLRIRFDPENGVVDHNFFLAHYALSALRERNRSPYNDALFICRRFPDAIVIIGHGNKIVVSSDNTVTKSAITIAERNRILIEELGISEEVTRAIPPDDEGGIAPAR
jgi:arylamine N-acetyltransferase|tara:strand:- start:463 stop:1338 length:876 start_codon:yes stop_codon:yes gene_type:complete